jgi:uncharacterized protein (DUF488 family)
MEHSIYTIGYEGVTADDLVRALTQAGVKVLMDIRAVPLSRKPGFSKNKLAERLKADGIRYIGLKGLGTPAEGRAAAKKGLMQTLRRIYSEHFMTDDAQRDFKAAMEIARSEPSCLLCFEHDERSCHRLIVAERMAEAAGFEIKHLNPAMPLFASAG